MKTEQWNEERRKLAKNVDELKDQVEQQSSTLQIHAQIVATHC